jgi:hypothetical protein
MPICRCSTKTIIKYKDGFEPDCDGCLNEEINVLRLKSTNKELKSLINRLDNLSDSVEHSLVSHRRPHLNVSQTIATNSCCCSSDDDELPISSSSLVCHYSISNECNICRVRRQTNNRQLATYEWTVCSDCDRMLRLSNELEKIKLDSTIYPITKYPSGRHHFCSSCENCIEEAKEHRRIQRRSRSRSKSRSDSPRFITRVNLNESDLPRPVWNGGPYKSYYGWTNWKLKEAKKE